MGDGEVKFSSLSPIMQGILVFLTILGMVVPATLGFVNFDKRLDIVEDTTDNHISKDERMWEKVDGEIDVMKDEIHAVELSQKEILAHYQEIIRRLDKGEQRDERILDKLEEFEVVQ